MTPIPTSWVEAEIGELCRLINGRAFKPSDWARDGLPIVRIQNLNNADADFNHYSGEVREKFLIDTGQLLFAWSGTPGTSFGAHVWEGGPAVLNQHIFKVEIDEAHLSKRFFMYAINQKLDELIDKAHGGVGLRHVTKGKFEETFVSLPPRPEQSRIAERLDGLNANLARARAELDHVPALISKYKKAVLRAAFSGQITKDVRQTGDDWKWMELSFEDVIDEGPNNGWSPKSGDDAEGALTLKLTATTSGEMRLDSDATKRIYEKPDEKSKYWLRPGDILIQRANTIDYVGATAIFNGPEKTYIYPDLMMRVRISDEELRKFVWRYLNSDIARNYLRSRATGTAGNMPKINSKTLKALPISLPQRDEMVLVNSRLDQALTKINRLSIEYESATKLLDNLDRSILEKAFRGELVHQDPEDEPASALLERIRNQREENIPPKRMRSTRSRSKTPKSPQGKSEMAKSRQDEDVFHQPYLARLLIETDGANSAEDLFKRSQLPITDFYKQLAWEVERGHILDAKGELKVA